MSPQSGIHGGPPQGKPARQLSSLGLLVDCFFCWIVDVFRARCSSVFHVCVSVFVPVLESILGASWVVFGAFGHRFLDLGQGSPEDALSGAFWSLLGGQLGSKLKPIWGPSWSQVAIKITFEVGQFFDPVSERNLQHLGLGFGRLWGAKMESKSELKIRRSKT